MSDSSPSFDSALDAAQPIEARLTVLARVVDLAADLRDRAALEQADAVVERISMETIPPAALATLAYFRANIWSAVHTIRGVEGPEVWEWQGEETQRELLYLRQAARHVGFVELDSVRKCQIETNLANLLNRVGRFVEAIEYWDRSLTRIPRFAMAHGNRGLALRSYAHALYDRGHTALMMLAVHDSFSAALDPDAFYDSPGTKQAQEIFRQRRDEIASHMDVNAAKSHFAKLAGSKTRSKGEQAYRQWCLNERLFLNPLNDLGALPVADHDVLRTPSFVTDAGEPPTPIRFYDIMKQEFVSSRYLLYAGLNSTAVHYSDRGVWLSNTLDYPAYALAVEHVKCAFRMAYSLFDKIAQFINHYWKLGVSSEHVAFRRIWYQQRGRGRILRDEFRRYPNWPLRGLFWLSRDMYDPAPGFRDHTEPDARELSELRNRFEHGFVSVHGIDWSDSLCDLWRAEAGPFAVDQNLYSVTRSDLAAKTLRILKLTRAALIYLALAMHAEEQRKGSDKESGRLTVPMKLDQWEDDWKR